MIDGFLLIDKEIGVTSRHVCNEISHKLKEKKVGHIGTLDPFASGLLIVTLGKANKAGAFLENDKKRYLATIKLGKATDSLDLTGKVIKEKEITPINEKLIVEVLNSFLGESSQVPPMTSAIHVDGKKLYELAHKGIEIERKPRKIFVYDIKLINFSEDEITFECLVSKGTYIRVLGEDIAAKLNNYGYLSMLRRISSGNVDIKEAKKVDLITPNDVKSVYDILSKSSKIKIVDDKLALDIANGKIKTLKEESKEKYLLVVNTNKNPIAMYEKISENIFEFKRGLF